MNKKSETVEIPLKLLEDWLTALYSYCSCLCIMHMSIEKVYEIAGENALWAETLASANIDVIAVKILGLAEGYELEGMEVVSNG